MKSKNIGVIFILLFFIGCKSSDIRESVKSAEDFKEMIINQLKDNIDTDSLAGSIGWGETYNSTYLLPIKDSNYLHSSTYKICLNVLSGWEKKYGFNVVSAGGGDNYFHMSYNNNSIQIFIDIISYKHDNGKNTINVFIRAH